MHTFQRRRFLPRRCDVVFPPEEPAQAIFTVYHDIGAESLHDGSDTDASVEQEVPLQPDMIDVMPTPLTPQSTVQPAAAPPARHVSKDEVQRYLKQLEQKWRRDDKRAVEALSRPELIAKIKKAPRILWTNFCEFAAPIAGLWWKTKDPDAFDNGFLQLFLQVCAEKGYYDVADDTWSEYISRDTPNPFAVCQI